MWNQLHLQNTEEDKLGINFQLSSTQDVVLVLVLGIVAVLIVVKVMLAHHQRLVHEPLLKSPGRTYAGCEVTRIVLQWMLDSQFAGHLDKVRMVN
jgi:hypothetical protein